MALGRLLALRALGLGDLLTAVPALRGLRRAHPQWRVELAAPEPLRPLLALLECVDGLVPVGPLEPLPPSAGGVDVAVNLHGRGPQSTALLRAAGPRRLVAYDEPGQPGWDDDEHERRRWTRLVTAAGWPADPDELDLPVPVQPPPVRSAVVLHPGAAAGSRRWPTARWARVATAVERHGGYVVVTGSPAERPAALALAEQAGLPPGRVLAGRTGLLELAALVAAARLVLSGDTGVAHLAVAFRTPSVTLFGPVGPDRWGPPAARTQHRVLGGGTPSDPFAPRPAPALLAVTVEQVLALALAG